MSRFNLRALAVVVVGFAVYASAPPNAEAAAFACPISTCIQNGVCPPDMGAWCAQTGCETTIHNCGPLFACSGDRVLFYCGTDPE